MTARICESICLDCGYDLHGLPEAGRCPECGQYMGLSRYGPQLTFSPPQWLETLRNGTSWLLAGILTIIVAALLFGPVELAGAGRSILRIPTTGLLMCGAIFGLLGFDRLTARDPLVSESQWSPRPACRLLIYSGLLLEVVTWFAKREPLITQPVKLISADICIPAGIITMMLYLRRLAVRLPEPVLARRLPVFAVAFGVWSGIILMVHCLLTLARFMRGTPAPAGATGLLEVAIYLSLILPNVAFGSWAAWLLARFRRGIKRTLRASGATETADVPP